VVAVVAGAGIGIRMLLTAAQKATRPDGCTFGADATLDLGQSSIASTMVSVVIKRELPERAAVLVLGAALQESKLRNIPSGQGDRDSVGVLQQRPSQGWGTAAELSDVHYATGKFLDALVKLPNWQTGDFADTIQRVQISAEGDAYAKHALRAQTVSDALMGKTPAAVSCSFSAPSTVAEASVVADRLSKDLPVATPSVQDRSISVAGAGWPTVGWLVTHADQYGIGAVRFSGQEWTRAKGWQARSDASGDEVVAEMATVKK
jgi:hypothetical protein